ncbi:TPA: hypothetical protein N0F65_006005 [Lagenidium giganteum]|uniref:LAGLIDADG endonuclease n=1 Tax=Lagenidium giganteum TaxID=4803 RepID=A0AAV2Z8V9_9STRA|nr:TPA: hypothetical protein N0F65_006005 [Lagenidium giganteum]
MLTALAVSRCLPSDRPYSRTGERLRHKYVLPGVGVVCKGAFQMVYDVANATLTAARAQLDNSINPKQHANTKNTHADTVDTSSIIAFLTEFAEQHGSIAPVRFRHQKTVSGSVKRYFSKVDYTCFPAFYTWEKLFQLFCADAKKKRIRYWSVHRCRRSVM